MTPVVRFAPSPTGYIHIGNLRTALFNWLFAKTGGADGRFILRFDDTDAGRSRREYADAIAEDLDWIGIRPDGVIRQSERLPLYEAAAERLKRDGWLYPCFETTDALDRGRTRRMARGLPPVYPRDALRLSEDERSRRIADGHAPHWRFRLPNFAADPFAPERTDIAWDDLVRGPQSVDLASLSDPVLVREDGTTLYTLTSVVDDSDTGITHVLRGGDHLTNTAVQIALFRALGLAAPAFGHHNLLTTGDGDGLSKRTGALSLRSLRADGIEPMAVSSLAVLVGLSGSIEAAGALDDLGRRLDLSAVSHSASRFDPAELEHLSAILVHRMPFADAADRLSSLGVPPENAEAFWLAVRGNCGRVADAALWRDVVYGPIPTDAAVSPDDVAFVRAAFDRLPPEPWNTDTWHVWTNALKSPDRKGRALFMPLRLALTGLDHGPDLSHLLPLIGRHRARARRP